jgi:hypothetical protein
MFHPVGHQGPSVYWRRRLIFAASIIALLGLIVVTAHVLLGSGSSKPRAAAGSSPNSPTQSAPVTQSTVTQPSISTSGSEPMSTTNSASSGTPSTGLSGSSSDAVALPCTASELTVSAATGEPEYTVGSTPVLMLQVIDKATVPCVQDLADKQIVMSVYNGVSRVWGSHDCEIQPGSDPRTLTPGQPVRISLVWSGLSSEPKCAGTRQRVGAGTYTLYVSLSGQNGTAAQFAMK